MSIEIENPDVIEAQAAIREVGELEMLLSAVEQLAIVQRFAPQYMADLVADRARQ